MLGNIASYRFMYLSKHISFDLNFSVGLVVFYTVVPVDPVFNIPNSYKLPPQYQAEV